MTATVAGIHLGPDTHANRPAGNAVPDGSFYYCSDHDIVYKSDFAGNSWSNWLVLASAGMTNPMTTQGDVIYGGASGTPTRLGIGTAGQVLKTNAGATAPEWADESGGGGDGYGAGYDPARPPASGLNAVSDEFADSSLHADWTWTTSPSGTISEAEYPGWLYMIGAGTDAAGAEYRLRRAFVPGGSTEFTIATRLRLAFPNGNFTVSIGVGALDTSDNVIGGMRLRSDGTSTASKAFRIMFGGGAPGSAFGPFQPPIGMIDMWFMIHRTTGDAYNYYFSGNGMVWHFVGTSSSGTSVQKVGITLEADTDAGGTLSAAVDFVRVFDAITNKIGAVAA